MAFLTSRFNSKTIFNSTFYYFSKRKFSQIKRDTAAFSYYVLLPEIPPDTKQNNSLLKTEEYPQFNEINPTKCVTGCAKKSIEFEVELGNYIETLKNKKHLVKFEDIFDVIEKLIVPLNYIWRTTKHLNYVQTKEGYQESFKRVHPQVENAKNQRWINHDLFLAIKELNINHRNDLNEFQRRLIDMYLLELRLNGIELTGVKKKVFLSKLLRLGELKNHFKNRMLMSHNLFSHTIEDFSIISELPKEFLHKISIDKNNPSRGPWKVNLNEEVYETMMTYCNDRMTRWNLWNAHCNRASMHHTDQNLSNDKIIEEIREIRTDIATLLNYSNFAELSMETKMASNVESVINLIESLKLRFQPVAESEINELQKFAENNGFNHKLEMWDIQYWRRKKLDQENPINEKLLQEYFPVERVIDYLFGFCRVLFGIKFVECTNEVDVWDKHVKFYRVYDTETNEQLSALYIDPYKRDNKIDGTWIEFGREKSKSLNITPFSYFNFNLMQPNENQITFVTLNDLQHIFYEFGHGLQQLCTEVPYSEISGQKNVEWDSLQVCAQLMQMILYTRQTLRFMGQHYQTGKPLSEDVINTIMRRRRHMKAYDIMTNLYFSAYDLEIYINHKESWHSLMQKVWSNFMPLPLDKNDNHPCSFSPIFSDNYPAAYYSFKWSEMIACDIFKSFKKASSESNENLIDVGNRFRKTFLSNAGGVAADELFRRFMGRDPTQDSLVSYYLRK